MMKLLKNLEYLIPLFNGMPTWVKSLFIIWCILSIFLLSIVASYTYSNNKQKAIKEEKYNLEMVKTQVNRLIEDFDVITEKIVEKYPEEIKQIKQQYNKNGIFDSSMHIRKQYDTTIDYKKKIDDAYKNLIRQTQDIMLKSFKKKDINTVSQMYAESEQIKKLYQKCEEAKKKFEEEPKKLDLQINKDKPIINNNFEMTKY